jgi:hypothetical protein
MSSPDGGEPVSPASFWKRLPIALSSQDVVPTAASFAAMIRRSLHTFGVGRA